VRAACCRFFGGSWLAPACWRLKFRVATTGVLGRPELGQRAWAQQAALVENCHGAKRLQAKLPHSKLPLTHDSGAS
jgi:hypothetical protein